MAGTDPGAGSRGLAESVLAGLIAQGLTDLVISPGSRSAPMAVAALAAERRGQLRLHVRIDERSAGFLALGLAKGSARAVAVLTTSGTAAANLHPAVLEASHARVPLIALTADRPLELVDSGANQTTRQLGLFGAAVRADAVLATGVAGRRAAATAQRLVIAALGSRSAHPGPVHLDLAFAEPLTSPPVGPVVVGPLQVSEPPVDVVELDPGPRTVVLVGDLPPEQAGPVLELAAAARLPVLSEPSGNCRRGSEAIAGHRLLLESGLGADVERVLLFGHPTLSRPVQRLLARSHVVAVGPGPVWTDVAGGVAELHDAVRISPAESGWLDRWRAADAALTARRTALATEQTGVAEAVLAALDGADTLLLGSSQLIRDADLAPIPADPPQIFANRGLAGIDGTVSTALGLALGGRRVTALVGDLTFLHDSGGLLVGPDEPRPESLRIVVANDDGGAIFHTLEQGSSAHAEDFERLFGTPHGTDLAALCAAHGVTHRRIEPAHLPAALASPAIGIEVVEVPLQRGWRREHDQSLRALVDPS